jgi:hypothetical protein
LALALAITLALGGAAYAVTSSTTSQPPTFSINPAVTTATTSPGGAVGYAINLQSLNGFSDNVTLSVAGLPPGATASFGSNPAFVDASLASASTLWINTSSTTPAGQYMITVSGTSSTDPNEQKTVTLNVVESTSQDYVIEMSPTTQYASAGGAVTYNVKIVPVNGFVGTVTLSVNSVPGAVSLGWNSTTPTTAQNPAVPVAVGGTNPGTATLNVSTTTTNPPGSYALTITGTSNSISHTTAGELDIDLFSVTGSVPATLYPGAAAQRIPLTLTDPYGYAVTVTGLAASVAQDSQGNAVDPTGKSIPGCLASWFQFKDTPFSPTNTYLLSGGSSSTIPATDDPTITMVESGTNQDACEGVTLKLNFVGAAQK